MPPVAVAVMLPLFPLQGVAMELAVSDNPDALDIETVVVLMHPFASFTVMVYDPVASPVNKLLL